jgi:hypothetical protein
MRLKKVISRREFIKDSSIAAAAVGTALLLGAQEPSAPKPAGKSRVVLVRNQAVLDADGNPKYEVVLEMLDAGVAALTGAKDPVSAWKTIVKPTDIVGIKSNVWNYLPTTTQVEQALKKRVMDAGVKEAGIGIDDRGVIGNPIFQKSTALINARPMRSHHWSGVGSLIKNYIMFIPDPLSYHPDSCASLASIWEKPLVKGKTRLNVLVMLTPQFHCVGPHSFNPKYVWKYYGLLLGFDPVSVDSNGLRIIEAIRKEYFAEDRPLDPPAKHIAIADTRYHLGTADPAKIELIKIGYDQDIFI